MECPLGRLHTMPPASDGVMEKVGGHPAPLLHEAPVPVKPDFGASLDGSPAAAFTWGMVAVDSHWSCSGPVQTRRSGSLIGRDGSERVDGAFGHHLSEEE